MSQLSVPDIPPPVSELRRRLIRGVSWSMGGTLLSQGLSLVAAVFVARMLGVERYGELDIIRSSTGLIGVMAGFGLGLTATKFVAEFRDSDRRQAGLMWGGIDTIAIFTCLAGCLAIILLAPVLADSVLGAPRLTVYLRISAALLLFDTLMGVQNGVLAGLEAFRDVALVGLCRGLISFPVMIGLTWLGGLTGAVWGLGLTALGGYIIGRFMLRRRALAHGVVLNRAVPLRQMFGVLRFSTPVVLSNLTVSAGQWAAGAMLVRQSGGFVQNGLFAAANRWVSLVAFLAITMAQPALSLLSHTFGQRSYVQFRRVVMDNVKIAAGGSALVALAVIVLAPWIMAAYGTGYANGVRVLQILSIMVVLRSTSRIGSQVLISVGRTKTEFVMSFCRILVFLALCWLLLERGALGLALAWMFSFAVSTPILGIYVAVIVLSLKSGGVPAGVALPGGEPGGGERSVVAR